MPLWRIVGDIKATRRIDTYGSQQDIAATLLAQLGIPHHSFTFSKNMLDAKAPHFAFFTIPDAFGVVGEGNTLIYNNKSSRIELEEGNDIPQKLLYGQASLQIGRE